MAEIETIKKLMGQFPFEMIWGQFSISEPFKKISANKMLSPIMQDQ
jgi:hypothetical protein